MPGLEANVEDGLISEPGAYYWIDPPTLSTEGLSGLLSKLEEGGLVFERSADPIS
jgi:hypothetical protein